MNRQEMKDKAKQIAQQAEDEAVKGLESAEAKWPIGTIIVVAVCAFIVGLYVRGLIH